MKPTIKITVSGPQGSGKTRLVDSLRLMPSWGVAGSPWVDCNIEFEEIQTPGVPAAVPVPLGPNRTRGGRKARVICIDRKIDEGGQPVLALVEDTEGYENTRGYELDGTWDPDQGVQPHANDLVGHLPLEPRKPKEVWIRFHKDSEPEVIVGLAPVAEPPFTLFREVLP